LGRYGRPPGGTYYETTGKNRAAALVPHQRAYCSATSSHRRQIASQSERIEFSAVIETARLLSALRERMTQQYVKVAKVRGIGGITGKPFPRASLATLDKRPLLMTAAVQLTSAAQLSLFSRFLLRIQAGEFLPFDTTGFKSRLQRQVHDTARRLPLAPARKRKQVRVHGIR
jgi:hypothetical protein